MNKFFLKNKVKVLVLIMLVLVLTVSIAWNNLSNQNQYPAKADDFLPANPTPETTLLVTSKIKQITGGESHTCALLSTGSVKCWGNGANGRLGYGNTDSVFSPSTVGGVNLGGTATQITAGESHTCALLSTGSVKCWGNGANGRLGYGNTQDVLSPSTVGTVSLGTTVTQITAGQSHTCALLSTNNVRCWGNGANGRLGNGNLLSIGDDELPSSIKNINVGGNASQITAGESHTCALLNSGTVKCWGNGANGRLGYGNTNSIGDDESPSSAGNINPGGNVAQISAGQSHTCALLTTGAVRCWGNGANGRLGYGNVLDISSPENSTSINMGGIAIQITTAGSHTCALLTTGAVRCWGNGANGRLGYGNTNSIGDDESPSSAGSINLGGSGTQVTSGDNYTCTLLTTGAVRCWGNGANGRLGYANTNSIGDDESPFSAGNIPITDDSPPASVINYYPPNNSVQSSSLLTFSGIGQAGSVITLKNSTNEILCITNVAADGTYSCTLTNLLPLGSNILNISQKDANTNLESAQTIINLTITPTLLALPYQPTILKPFTGSSITSQTPLISGVASANSNLQVVDGSNNVLCSTTSNAQSEWSCTSTTLGYGTHSLRAISTNTTGSSGYSIQVNINIMSISSVTPSEGTTDGGTNITINGTGLINYIPLAQITAGESHTCALLTTGGVKCWGNGANGRLGYGNTDNVFSPSIIGNVNLGGTATQITAGESHTCALLTTGGVKCWGNGANGRLGYGNITDVLNPSTVGGVNLGNSATQITAGESHSCALLIAGTVKCWGNGANGRLGYGNITDVLNPSTVGGVNAGDVVKNLSTGSDFNCTIILTGKVRCWGNGATGRLGYGNTDNIGDDESPVSVGDVITTSLVNPVITLGGITLSNVVYISQNQLTAITPARTEGFVDITATNPDGQSATLASAYKYVIVCIAGLPNQNPTCQNTGNLFISVPKNITFNSISDATVKKANALVTGITISDTREAKPGWVSSCKLTNFSGTTYPQNIIQLATSQFGGISRLRLTPSSLTSSANLLNGLVDSVSTQNVTSLSAMSAVGETNPFTIAQFPAGYGLGVFQKNITLEIDLPPFLYAQKYHSVLTCSVS